MENLGEDNSQVFGLGAWGGFSLSLTLFLIRDTGIPIWNVNYIFFLIKNS